MNHGLTEWELRGGDVKIYSMKNSMNSLKIYSYMKDEIIKIKKLKYEIIMNTSIE